MEVSIKQYLFGIIKLMPKGAEWHITSSFKELEEIISILNPEKEDLGYSISLSTENKAKISSLLNDYPLEDMIERHSIRDCRGDLFKAYDNLEFGILSKRIDLPKGLSYLIEEQYLSISEEW